MVWNTWEENCVRWNLWILKNGTGHIKSCLRLQWIVLEERTRWQLFCRRELGDNSLRRENTFAACCGSFKRRPGVGSSARLRDCGETPRGGESESEGGLGGRSWGLSLVKKGSAESRVRLEKKISFFYILYKARKWEGENDKFKGMQEKV